jgi:hypothetical protein
VHRLTITAVVLLAAGSVATGQEELLRWFEPEGFGSRKVTASYDVEGHCPRGVSEQDEELGWAQHSLRVLTPLFSDDVNELSLTAGLDAWDVDTGAVLPDTGETFPDHLWDVRAGANYRRLLGDGQLLGLRASVGSPSDKPFASDEEVSVDATGFYRLPAGEHAAWVFLLSYSNTREFCRHVPLPGVGWHWRPNPQLNLLAGVPFAAARWSPQAVPELNLSGSYILPRTVHARIGYELTEATEVYTAFDWSHERWLRHDRPDDDDRLTFYSKQVRGGVVWRVGGNVTLEGFGGYAFDRFFFEGEDYDDRDQNRLDVSDGAFAGVKVRVRL